MTHDVEDFPEVMPAEVSAPRLLRVPKHLRRPADVLNTALRMDLDEVIVLSQRPDGGLIWLAPDGMTCERANWLMDMFKHFLLTAPVLYERKDGP